MGWDQKNADLVGGSVGKTKIQKKNIENAEKYIIASMCMYVRIAVYKTEKRKTNNKNTSNA